MTDRLTQEITEQIYNLTDTIGRDDVVLFRDELTTLIILTLEQAKAEAQKLIDERLQGHIFASHTALADGNGE